MKLYVYLLLFAGAFSSICAAGYVASSLRYPFWLNAALPCLALAFLVVILIALYRENDQEEKETNNL